MQLGKVHPMHPLGERGLLRKGSKAVARNTGRTIVRRADGAARLCDLPNDFMNSRNSHAGRGAAELISCRSGWTGAGGANAHRGNSFRGRLTKAKCGCFVGGIGKNRNPLRNRFRRGFRIADFLRHLHLVSSIATKRPVNITLFQIY